MIPPCPNCGAHRYYYDATRRCWHCFACGFNDRPPTHAEAPTTVQDRVAQIHERIQERLTRNPLEIPVSLRRWRARQARTIEPGATWAQGRAELRAALGLSFTRPPDVPLPNRPPTGRELPSDDEGEVIEPA